MKNLLLAIALVSVSPFVAAEQDQASEQDQAAEASKPNIFKRAGSFAFDTLISPWTATKEVCGQVKKAYNAYAPNRATVGHVAKRTVQVAAFIFAALMLNKGGKYLLSTKYAPTCVQNGNPLVSTISKVAGWIPDCLKKAEYKATARKYARTVGKFLLSHEFVSAEKVPTDGPAGLEAA